MSIIYLVPLILQCRISSILTEFDLLNDFSDAGKDERSSVLVVAIVVPTIVIVLLLIAGYCFLAKRAKRTNETELTFNNGKDSSDY